jgi:chaperonin GroES
MKPKNKPTRKIKTIKPDIDKLRFLGDHVLVIPVMVEQSRGLIKPDQYDDKPEFGKVVKKGGEVIRDIKVNDTVLFGKWSTILITIDGIDYLMMREEDVIGVIR